MKATEAQIKGQMASLFDEASMRHARLRRLHSGMSDLAKQERSESVQRATRARQKADRDRLRGLSELEAELDARRTTALEVIREVSRKLAPGTLGASWGASEWGALEVVGGLPSAVRWGTFRIGDVEVPAQGRLVGSPAWHIDSSTADFWRLHCSITLRTIAACGRTGVEIYTWDPEFESFTGAFDAIRQVQPSVIPIAAASEAELVTVVDTLLDGIRDRMGTLRAQGLNSLAGAVDSGLDLGVPFRMLFLGGPVPDQGDLSEKIARLCRSGPDAGVLVVGSSACGLPAASAGAVEIEIKNGRIKTGGTPADIDPAPVGAELVEVIHRLASRVEKSTPPVVDFADLLASDTVVPWMEAGDEGVEALIGCSGFQPLTVSFRSANPPTPNCLVAGAVGQGKTNLLQVVLYSLATRYSPADLQFVVLDLKDGVEFNTLGPDQFGSNWMPHLKSLGLAFDIDYVVSILNWASAELTSRNALFREERVSGLGAYRASTGRALPRILLVIDEFHRMFESDDQRSDEATRLLEHLSRTGRSAGVHLLLSSQTTSGIPALAAKSGAIFSQFHTRVSLKNSPEEAQTVMGPGNSAPADLDHRGEVIVNDDLGRLDRNRRGMSAFADPLMLTALQSDLWRRGSGEPPKCFDAQAKGRWDSDKVVGFSAGRQVTLEGQPDRIELAHSSSENIAVLGTDTDLAVAVLQGLCLGANAAVETPLRIVVLDGLSGPTGAIDRIARFCSLLEYAGVDVRMVSESELIPWVAAAVERGSVDVDIVVSCQIESIPELIADDPMTFVSPARTWGSMMRSLPRTGTHVIAWWRSLQSASTIDIVPESLVQTAVLARASKDDLSRLCGALYPAPSIPWRATVVDVGTPASARTVVPYDFDELSDVGGRP